tara:strand:+ start:298 stop:1578 length:1281 start_codon:yes stop_codon:yes gene_type:complete
MNAATYNTTVLENGVTVVTAEMPFMESVCVGAWAAVGSRYESPALNGIAHFVEHLLFKGTPTRDAIQISREIEGIGASVDAFTTEDHTCFYTRGPAETLGLLTDVLMDLVCHPNCDPVEIEREREVILEEINMYRDNPSQHVEDLLGAAAWPEHPLGRPITGTSESVEEINRGDLFSFHQTRYTGENLIISAAGKLNHAEFLALVQPLVEHLPKGEKLTCPKVPESMKESGPRRCEEIRDHIEQAHVCIGFHTHGRHATERHGLKILNVLLGENMSSKLFQVLREENGLCYSVFSDVMNLEDTGLLSISTGLDLENVPKALDLIADCLHDFQANKVNAKMLDQAVTYTIGQGRMALESTANQMMWCGESLLAYGRVIEPAESFAKLRGVTAGEVQELAKQTFRPSTTAIAYIGADVPDLALNAFLT